jgi:hypothetical protein
VRAVQSRRSAGKMVAAATTKRNAFR